MTAAARKVLEDCRVALSMLEDEKDLQKWRIIWVSAVALLRTVGYVLDKVDGEDPTVRAVARTLFKRWRGDDANDEIFREFIEKERNFILKEYQVNIHPMEEVPVLISAQLASVDGSEQNLRAAFTDMFPDNIYRPVLEGAYEGDDARDVYEIALSWWVTQLRSVDRKVARLKRTTQNGRKRDGHRR